MEAAVLKAIFEYTDYKAFLESWIASRPQGGRGIKSKMAQAMRCQLAYLSQVLNGPAHLSLEQAEALNGILDHSHEEGDFFLLLLQRARAGTPGLRKHFAQFVGEGEGSCEFPQNTHRDEKLWASKKLVIRKPSQELLDKKKSCFGGFARGDSK